jgi:hypothetical protein
MRSANSSGIIVTQRARSRGLRVSPRLILSRSEELRVEPRHLDWPPAVHQGPHGVARTSYGSGVVRVRRLGGRGGGLVSWFVSRGSYYRGRSGPHICPQPTAWNDPDWLFRPNKKVSGRGPSPPISVH